ncbi:unnamed protein product [Aphanomyces euteiches]
MAWCRWSDAKTLCEYLVTRSISNEIDPRNLLRSGRSQGDAITEKSTQILPFDVDSIATALYEKLEQSLPKPSKAQSTTKRQESIAVFLNQKSIPTARSAKDVWQRWFTADPKVGLRRPLKDFTKSIILSDKKRYSERQTIALAFSKYQNLAQFEAAYAGYTDSYAKLLHEELAILNGKGPSRVIQIAKLPHLEKYCRFDDSQTALVAWEGSGEW